MDKPVLAFDIDDTLLPYISVLIEIYNHKYNDNVKYENLTDYNIQKFLKSEAKNLWEEFGTEDLFLTTPPYSGVFQTIEQLENDCEVIFITAGRPSTMLWRDEWFKKYYRNYNSDQLGRLKHKQLLSGNVDILVDDYIENLIGFNRGFLIDQPWNRQFSKRWLRRNNITRIQSVVDLLNIL